MVDPIEYAWRALNRAPFPAVLGGFVPNNAHFMRKPMQEAGSEQPQAAPMQVERKSLSQAQREAELAVHRKSAPRMAAKAAGQMFYDGAACTYGHTRRYTSTGSCVECAREACRKGAAARDEYRDGPADAA